MLRRILSESCRKRTANPVLMFHFLGLLVRVLGGGLMLFLGRAFGATLLNDAAILQPVPVKQLQPTKSHRQCCQRCLYC